MPPRDAHRVWRAAMVFGALTLVATYPLALAPASYTYFHHSDAQLNMWILAWDARAIHQAPTHLFDANIFSPEPGTLAYSETLLGYLPIFGPILWLHGSPVLAFNVVLLFSFAASGFTMYLLARHLTGREWPAYIAGIVYAFTPYRFVHIPQIQLESMEWIPLAFLCLHRFFDTGKRWFALGVGGSVAMQALCCVYYSVFLAIALAIATVLLVTDRDHRHRWRALATLLLVAGLTSTIIAPVLGEYVRVHRTQHLARSIDEIAKKSAEPATYVASSSHVHRQLWAAFLPTPRDYLFPGIAAVFFAGIGLASRRRDVLVYAAIVAMAVAASFGPGGLAGVSLYGALYRAVPVLHGLRQVSRFGVLVIFGVGVLAAIGAERAESRVGWFGTWAPAVTAVVFLELLVAPLRADRPGGEPLVRLPPTPPVYRWLAQQKGEFAIIEFPYAHLGQLWENASYVFWSTVHWHGVVNGYSGFASPDYASLERILSGFPDDLSRQALQLRHVRYAIVHRDLYRPWNPPLNFDRIRRTEWLAPVASFPDVDVFWLRPEDRLLTYVDGR